MSPVFRHGRLRLYLLRLLDEAPRHGYDVIRLLQDRFLGVYSPSAGTIYPRLARLEADGLITHEEVDGRKVYRITERGREELRRRSRDLAELEEEIIASVHDIAMEVSGDVRATVRSLRDEITSAARQMRGGGTPRRPAAGPWQEAGGEESGQDRRAAPAGPGAGRGETGSPGERAWPEAHGGQERAHRNADGCRGPWHRQARPGRDQPWWQAQTEREQARRESHAGQDRAQRETGSERGHALREAEAARDRAWREAGSEREQARTQRERARLQRGEARAQRGERSGEDTGQTSRGTGQAGRDPRHHGEGAGRAGGDPPAGRGVGPWPGWAGWAGGRDAPGPGPGDPQAYRDVERLARQFSREFQRAAEQAQAAGEEAVASLHDILADTLQRIRAEVLRPGGHRREEPGEGHARQR